MVSPDKASLNKVVFSPDGTKLIAGGKSGLLVIWDLLPAAPEELEAGGGDGGIPVTSGDTTGTKTSASACVCQ